MLVSFLTEKITLDSAIPTHYFERLSTNTTGMKLIGPGMYLKSNALVGNRLKRRNKVHNNLLLIRF